MIRAKRAAGRAMDLANLDTLREIERLRRPGPGRLRPTPSASWLSTRSEVCASASTCRGHEAETSRRPARVDEVFGEQELVLVPLKIVVPQQEAGGRLPASDATAEPARISRVEPVDHHAAGRIGEPEITRATAGTSIRVQKRLRTVSLEDGQCSGGFLAGAIGSRAAFDDILAGGDRAIQLVRRVQRAAVGLAVCLARAGAVATISAIGA